MVQGLVVVSVCVWWRMVQGLVVVSVCVWWGMVQGLVVVSVCMYLVGQGVEVVVLNVCVFGESWW